MKNLLFLILIFVLACINSITSVGFDPLDGWELASENDLTDLSEQVPNIQGADVTIFKHGNNLFLVYKMAFSDQFTKSEYEKQLIEMRNESTVVNYPQTIRPGLNKIKNAIAFEMVYNDYRSFIFMYGDKYGTKGFGVSISGDTNSGIGEYMDAVKAIKFRGI